MQPPTVPPGHRPGTEEAADGTRLGRDFWKLFSAITLSNTADGVRLVSFPWLAATLTRDPLMVAGVAAAGQLPWLAAVRRGSVPPPERASTWE